MSERNWSAGRVGMGLITTVVAIIVLFIGHTFCSYNNMNAYFSQQLCKAGTAIALISQVRKLRHKEDELLSQ